MHLHGLLIKLQSAPYNLTQSQTLDLLAFLLNLDRNHFWNHLDCLYWGSPRQLQESLELIKNNYPLAYIVGQKHFFGADFYVDQRVLIPRDETEGLVKFACDWLENHPQAQIVDVGTGSGVIGLSLKKRFPQTQVWLSDNSWPALQVAQKNAQLLNLEAHLLLGDFLDPAHALKIKANLIITNPPYVDKEEYLRSHELSFEPRSALTPTGDALYFYKQLFSQWRRVLDWEKPCALMMEFGHNQKSQLELLLHQTDIFKFFLPRFYRDWNYHWRYLILEKRSDAPPFPN